MRFQSLVLLGMVALVAAMLGRMGMISESGIAFAAMLFCGVLIVTMCLGLLIGAPMFLLITSLMAVTEWIEGRRAGGPRAQGR